MVLFLPFTDNAFPLILILMSDTMNKEIMEKISPSIEQIPAIVLNKSLWMHPLIESIHNLRYVIDEIINHQKTETKSRKLKSKQKPFHLFT